MDTIALKARAKVNIGLQIIDQREDGYHNIHTTFQELELHDKIELKKGSAGCNIKINDPNIPTDNTNTCAKAYFLLKEHFPQIDGVEIAISKIIPSGAGLGGGSSDAAATLKGLIELFNLSITNTELCAMAARVGADVPFFISGGTQVGNGIGDELAVVNHPVAGYYLLVIPEIFISTAWAYKSIKKYLKTEQDRPNFAHFLENNNLSNVIFENDFERIVIPTYPEIGEIKADLLNAGASYASLSGSGSTVFGVFDEEAKARKAESIIQKQYQTFLTRPTNI